MNTLMMTMDECAERKREQGIESLEITLSKVASLLYSPGDQFAMLCLVEIGGAYILPHLNRDGEQVGWGISLAGWEKGTKPSLLDGGTLPKCGETVTYDDGSMACTISVTPFAEESELLGLVVMGALRIMDALKPK